MTKSLRVDALLAQRELCTRHRLRYLNVKKIFVVESCPLNGFLHKLNAKEDTFQRMYGEHYSGVKL